MNLVKNRVAAFGAAGALAAGSVLAGGVLSPASAVDTTYTCTTTAGAIPFPVSVDNPFPSSVATGQQVGAQEAAQGQRRADRPPAAVAEPVEEGPDQWRHDRKRDHGESEEQQDRAAFAAGGSGRATPLRLPVTA